MTTLMLSIDFEIQQCIKCGVHFGVTKYFDSERRKDAVNFYCPNGHPQAYTESLADKMRRERDRAVQDQARLQSELGQALQRANDQAAARRLAEDDARRAKSATQRLKKRAAAGTCPCCQRSFANMSTHMKREHPGYVESTGAKVVAIKPAARS